MTNADIIAQLRKDVAAASPRPWKPGPSEQLCQGMLSTDDGEYICEFYLTTIAAEEGTLPGAANARLAALDGPALLEALVKAKSYMVADGARGKLNCQEEKCLNEMCAVNRAIADAGKALGL